MPIFIIVVLMRVLIINNRNAKLFHNLQILHAVRSEILNQKI